jgi:hypothetical protein
MVSSGGRMERRGGVPIQVSLLAWSARRRCGPVLLALVVLWLGVAWALGWGSGAS